MLTIKILFTINSLKKYFFRQSTIYNSFRLKKHLFLIRKNSFNFKKFGIKNISFRLKQSILITKKKKLNNNKNVTSMGSGR